MRPKRSARKRVRLALLGAILCLGALPAAAQVYGSETDPPVTTDRGRLEGRIIAREIHERFLRGYAAETAHQWLRAEMEFSRIVALQPSEPQGSTALYDLGVAQVALGKNGAAAANFRAALARDPQFAAAAANLTTVALRMHDLVTARSAAQRLLQIAPASARARFSHGLVAVQSGDWLAAQRDFLVLQRDNPAYAFGSFELALIDMRLTHFEAARRRLERALQLAPTFVRARFALAVIDLRLRRIDEAKAALNAVIGDPRDSGLRASALALRSNL